MPFLMVCFCLPIFVELVWQNVFNLKQGNFINAIYSIFNLIMEHNIKVYKFSALIRGHAIFKNLILQ